MALNINATSATLRAIGPSTLNVDHAFATGHDGTRPGDGRMPTMPQKLAGLRSEPPMSVPSAIGSMRVASATAAPPLLPPHVLLRSCGLSVDPNTGLKVCEPAPNSGVLVFPRQIAPATPQPFDRQRIFGGDEVLVDRRSERRAHSLGRLQILVRDRQAVQRADVSPVREIFVGDAARAPSPDPRRA